MCANCAICTDQFSPSENISSTVCGHLFHNVCLQQWLKNSLTCPQCRNITTYDNIHRVYINFIATKDSTTNLEILQKKLNRLQSLLEAKDEENTLIQGKYKRLKLRCYSLNEEIKKLEYKFKEKETSLGLSKKQVLHLKRKVKNSRKLEEKLRKKLKTMEKVNTVINGTQDEVHDILKMQPDPNDLALMISSLKIKLQEKSENKIEFNRYESFLKDEIKLDQDINKRTYETFSENNIRQDSNKYFKQNYDLINYNQMSPSKIFINNARELQNSFMTNNSSEEPINELPISVIVGTKRKTNSMNSHSNTYRKILENTYLPDNLY